MDFQTVINIISMGITAGTPLLFAALAGVIAERSGVFNIGIEGFMLMGAITAFSVAAVTQNKWMALLATLLICGILGLLLALLSVTLHVNQIVVGIAYTIFLTGLSSVFGKPYLGKTAGDRFSKLFVSEDNNWIMQLLSKDILVYIAIIVAILLWIFIYKTKPGLHLRACGESPDTIDSLGVNVFRIRYCTLVVSGMLAGLGGAYLSLSYTPMWTEGMSAGRGWLAIALISFSMWNPVRAIACSYLFGIVYALSYKLEALGVPISSSILRMLPYMISLLSLVLVSIRFKKKGSIAPRACGTAYVREGK